MYVFCVCVCVCEGERGGESSRTGRDHALCVCMGVLSDMGFFRRSADFRRFERPHGSFLRSVQIR